MNSPLIQLLVLAGIAVFLILRLKSVLGSREGFEKPSAPEKAVKKSRKGFEVIEGGPDRDITDHVPENDEAAHQLAAMKRVEPEFSVTEFVQGARGAYEMIVMGFERGNMTTEMADRPSVNWQAVPLDASGRPLPASVAVGTASVTLSSTSAYTTDVRTKPP